MPQSIGSVRIGLRTVGLYAFTGEVTSMKTSAPFRDPDTGQVTDLRSSISTKVNLVGGSGPGALAAGLRRRRTIGSCSASAAAY